MKQTLAIGLSITLALLVGAGVGYYLKGDREEPQEAKVAVVSESEKTPSLNPEPTAQVQTASTEQAVGAESLQEPLEIDTAASVRNTVRANTAFATDLYQILLKDNNDENQFFSPYSISTILGLTAAGARGKTSAEMNKLLHVSQLGGLHAGVAELTRNLTSREGGARPYQLSIANSLWGSSLYLMLPSFTGLAEKYYGTSGVHSADFRSNPEAARTRINRWVEDQTMSRIQDLLPPNAITQYTALVLANAVYFKGDWEKPFDLRLTRNDVFHASVSRDVPISLMRAAGKWKYFEDDDVQVVSLPIAGPGSVVPSMVIVLPRKNDGLSDLEKDLTPEVLGRWFNGLEERPGQVLLPRFTMTRANDLKAPLKDMGMVEAFDPQNANFRAMATPPPGDNIYISGVYHKAFVDVNEQGLEAAAATAVVGAGGGPPPSNPFLFRADHPFFFALRVEPSNEILFMGRLVSPDNPAPVVAENAPPRGRGERGVGERRGERGERGRGGRGERGERGARRGVQPAVTIVFKDAVVAANEALGLIAVTRQDSTFVSPQVHPGLWDILNSMESAARAVIGENRSNEAAYAAAGSSFANVLTQGITLTGQIAVRASETQATKQKSLALQAKFREIEAK